jgi:mRNA interferase RelE/StbE
MLSVHFVTMTFMSELPAGDTHDVIRQSGQVVAVVVPIEEYRQLRQAMQEQQVNEEFDAARAGYLARREAGTIRYVSHEEAGRRLGMSSRWAIRSTGRFKTAGFLRDDRAGVAALWDSISQLADEPRPPESFPYGSPDLRRLRAGRYRVFYTIDEERRVIQIDHVARLP